VRATLPSGPVPEVKAKKRCCQSRPRCKRCPVVLRRLAKAGLAEQDGRGYDVRARPKQWKAARKGKKIAVRG
jgi:hypothetical protein